MKKISIVSRNYLIPSIQKNGLYIPKKPLMEHNPLLIILVATLIALPSAIIVSRESKAIRLFTKPKTTKMAAR